MMSNFILEIFSEEMPAKMQKTAAENLAKIAEETFLKAGLIFERSMLKTFVTPLRLVLEIQDLPEVQKIAAIRKVGPKINADKRAIEGFLKSNGLSDESQLEKIENSGQPCYVYVKPACEIQTAEILKNSLPQILQKMVPTWPKLMRWDIEQNQQPRWIRPIRNIACIFGKELIEIEFAGLKSNKLTFAKNLQSLEIADASGYQNLLEKNFVILNHEQRKQKIIEQVRKIKFELGLELVDEEEKSPLFDELTGLCEWPSALVASIDTKFLDLPDEVLILTLRSNQKYLCLKNHDGSLAPQFIFIAGLVVDESNRQKIILDNEKLVRARLSDAEFFIHEDIKIPLESRLGELKKIVFHQKIGSIYHKTKRLNGLTKFLSIFVPHCDLSLAERAAILCKADLATKAVGELPELQGKIGSFYAHKQKENNKIIAAIYEHYLPLGPNSALPKTALGIALSIADKMDSISGFFLANEKPTSSKDPYALRRAALGIIRIGFHHNIAFPIRILVEKSLNFYPQKLQKILLENDEKNLATSKKILIEEIIKFFVERLKVYLKENENLRPDIVNAVVDEYLSDLDAHKYVDILYLAKKIKFLNKFLIDEKHKNLIGLYKRAANILAIEEKKDGEKYVGKPSRLAFKTKYEKVLYQRLKQVSGDFKKLVIKGEFEIAFKLLDVLEAPLAHFFENVVVNDESKDLRKNRLLLLAKIRALFNQVADLSKVEIS